MIKVLFNSIHSSHKPRECQVPLESWSKERQVWEAAVLDSEKHDQGKAKNHVTFIHASKMTYSRVRPAPSIRVV